VLAKLFLLIISMGVEQKLTKKHDYKSGKIFITHQLVCFSA
jgi:hypothetical protein